ncbi:hypothetical protein ACFVTX_04545 [Agromyces sp. NPDC058136]|uniref:hypothetical protein n=1 Tax=Agromyces sp. NPDC058136 TaxID=3346354 RepID=UPI0036DD0CEC
MSSTTPGSEPADEAGRDDANEPESDAIPEAADTDGAQADGVADEPAAVDAPEPAPEPAPESAHEPAPAPEPAYDQPDEPDTVSSAADDAAVAAGPDDHPVDADATEPAPLDEPEPGGASETSALDAAVLRANAGAEASEPGDGIDDAETAPQPVAAGSVRRETYVPASTAAVAAATGAATLAPEPPSEPVFPGGPQTVYVQAPEPPRAKGNRAFGTLVALIGAALFAALYAGVAYLLLLSQGDPAAVNTVFVERFLAKPVYWVPIVAFFVGFTLLAAIVNRGRWWAYVVFGLLVGVLVYFSYLGGALLTVEAWTLTFPQAQSFIADRWLDPFAIVAALIAREIPIWLGGWIAARGRTVTERNRLAVEEYDRELAAGPQLQR